MVGGVNGVRRKGLCVLCGYTDMIWACWQMDFQLVRLEHNRFSSLNKTYIKRFVMKVR